MLQPARRKLRVLGAIHRLGSIGRAAASMSTMKSGLASERLLESDVFFNLSTLQCALHTFDDAVRLCCTTTVSNASEGLQHNRLGSPTQHTDSL
jgi:hypothetical protein